MGAEASKRFEFKKLEDDSELLRAHVVKPEGFNAESLQKELDAIGNSNYFWGKLLPQPNGEKAGTYPPRYVVFRFTPYTKAKNPYSQLEATDPARRMAETFLETRDQAYERARTFLENRNFAVDFRLQ